MFPTKQTRHSTTHRLGVTAEVCSSFRLATPT